MPSFLCLAQGDAIVDHLPSTNVRLAVDWWWAMPSLIELRVLFRSVEDGTNRCRETWREHVLPSLVGADVELAEHLWDDVFDNADLVERRLGEYAAKRGWTAERLGVLGLDTGMLARQPLPSVIGRLPPVQMRALWSQGLVNETAEHGIEVSSAALAVLGRREALAHRLWRGQAGLLLPLLDAVRLDLCMALASEYGSAWPARIGWPADEGERRAVEDDPFTAQWGYLSMRFRSTPGLRARSNLRDMSGQAWEIRNELAHYKPVRFEQFRRLWEQSNGFAMAVAEEHARVRRP